MVTEYSLLIIILIMQGLGGKSIEKLANDISKRIG